MRTFCLYLKSFIDAPDFEDYLEAESPKEALELFKEKHKSYLADFEDDFLLDNIADVETAKEEAERIKAETDYEENK